MTAIRQQRLLSVEDYLAGERHADTKHEYLGGLVYAMAGASNRHNTIAVNLIGTLHRLLRGHACRPFNSDTKIRIRLASQVRFYYPDASVVCQPGAPDESFQEDPLLVAEVLSDSTRRIDEGEKKDAYLAIPSLRLYLLLEPEMAAATLFRRTDAGFIREVYEGLSTVVRLPELGIELPLGEMYEGLQF
jgi:Uma2 family endonuclease